MEAKSYKVYGARLYNDIFVLSLPQGKWIFEARQTWSLVLIEARSVCNI